MSSSAALVGAALVLLATTACAPRQRALASRFVTPGTPTIDLGGPTVNLVGIEAAVHGRPAGKADKVDAAGARAGAVDRRTPLEQSQHPRSQFARAPAGVARLCRCSRRRSATSTPPPPTASAGVRDRAFDYLSEGVRRDPTNAGAARRAGPGVARLGLRRTRVVGRPSRGLLRPAVGRGAQHAGHDPVGAGPAHARPAWPSSRRPSSTPAPGTRGATLRGRAGRGPHQRRDPDVPAGDDTAQGGNGEATMRGETIGRRRQVVPAAPRTLEEAGLSFDAVMQLVLKLLHFAGELSGAELGERLGLRYSVLEPVLHHLRTTYLCEVSGGGLHRRPLLRLPGHRCRPRPRHAVPRTQPLRRRGAGALPPLRALHARRSTSRSPAASPAPRCSRRCRTWCSATG